ncbi:MAG: FlgO family outer membrane protein [Succinivibrio sp.]
MKMLSLTACLILAGCSANPAQDGKVTETTSSQVSVYDQKGMEVSRIVSMMADSVYQTMINDLAKTNAPDKALDKSDKIVSDLPKVAVTSFVDTDTYEDAGYLGRAMAEMFVHELDRRGIGVFEYKLTGAISITKDGEFVFSRNWKKVARQAMVKHILAGTLTRNDSGIVVVGRVINMATSTVVGSATGFIPYDRLPYCYRTGKKNCSLNGVTSYLYDNETESVKGTVKDTLKSTKVTVIESTASASTTDTPVYAASEKAREKAKIKEFKDNYYRTDSELFNSKYYVKGAKVPATSSGNYERYMFNKEHSFNASGKDPVIYPADTYLYQQKLVRDVQDQSQYSRTR